MPSKNKDREVLRPKTLGMKQEMESYLMEGNHMVRKKPATGPRPRALYQGGGDER